jgi:hypothetical protein
MLLNALLFPEVEWPGFKIVGNRGFSWVNLPLSGEETAAKSVYCERGYFYDGQNPQPDGFSELDGIAAIPTLRTDRYYAGVGDGPEVPPHIGSGVPLYLPEDFNLSIELFSQLSDLNRDRFWRACYWLAQVNSSPSFSIRLLFTVQAIESLVPAQSRAMCKECGKPTGPGPTALFREFLDEYAPNSGKNVTSGHLYDARSGITHGSGLFLVDMDEMSDFSPKTSEQRNQLEAGFYRSIQALHKWLHTPLKETVPAAVKPDAARRGGDWSGYLYLLIAAVVLLIVLSLELVWWRR